MTSNPEYNDKTNGSEVAAAYGDAIKGRVGTLRLSLHPSHPPLKMFPSVPVHVLTCCTSARHGC